jgi:alkanesulfonate monooxygenase SsuD/methylene tetrahydromethanopterin reductase-like flavin-dependent oxidoreductase (luciferase family)
MFECFIFQNGALNLPTKTMPNGVVICDGTLQETQRAAQRLLIDQIRQGILADRLGYSGFCVTEHHFSVEGAEFTPSPILLETAIATQTNRIRLIQLANIVSQHEPIRLAEQAAMLDVISGGRMEFGMGRGYQSREVEMFGATIGSTLMDEERNRVWFDEIRQFILRAWTQDSISFKGDNFQLPPKHLIWNHKQTIAFYENGKAGREVEDVFDLGPPRSSPVPIFARRTTMKEFTVYPQPLQKPHPQIWQVASTERSIRLAAANGANTALEVPNLASKRDVATYYDECEKAGWPDRLQPGKPFKYGWDSQRRRGVLCNRFVHIADKGIGDLKRAARALELQWDYFGPFGFTAALANPGEKIDNDFKATAEWLRNDRKMALHGSVQQVIDGLMAVKEAVGYKDDFAVMNWFELGGFSGTEIEEQMQLYAEEVMPVLERECGGRAELPVTNVSFEPTVQQGLTAKAGTERRVKSGAR